MVVPSEKKPLRSCARCRKNKIKCDSFIRRPEPCSSCVKKGVECHVDYVNPPQRSQEMKVLFDNIKYAKERISSLCAVYDRLLEDAHVGRSDMQVRKLDSPTRILKILDKFYLFVIDEDAGSFYVNNYKIDLRLLEESFEHFRKLISKSLEIYVTWENVRDIEGRELDLFISQFSLESMVENNQLLLLICILNFYFDIPGLDYLKIYNHVVDSYCDGASKNGTAGSKFLSKSLLAKLVIGDSYGWHFHSEMFIKHFTVYLFLHVVLYGPQHFMACFMDRYIRILESLRKKINFDKNWEVKWVNFYIRLLNLVESRASGEEGRSVDEVVLEVMLNDVYEKDDLLSSFICLVNIDQYLVERRAWPLGNFSKSVLHRICKRVGNVLAMDFSGTERPSFLELLFAQLLSLNKLLCINNHFACDLDDQRMNGFNQQVYVEVGDRQMEAAYSCQAEYHLVSGYDENENGYALKLAGPVVGKHRCRLSSRCLIDIVESDLDAYRNRDDMALKILKSSCLLIWSLYEHVIYYETLNRVLYYVPFEWNAQLLLETSGLVCQHDDQRARVKLARENNGAKGDAGIDRILNDVDWMKESADDVLRKIHGVLN
ncbi:hypothetical protein HG536_0B01390 [Torulaspora globosa]|uniref:Zn(2)-C6 fungal-type domain-containing protein n=1 Tax=Torulaspora globosa TaxID=48254 RepID=A0A7G3ZCP1_9SACH|nr:uncharacterized protein HG536_0B01390 [Torulaspora globosa]QLL31277.1 hypothetical protein HG536_0B01390 [Torulaspora globosa]